MADKPRDGSARATAAALAANVGVMLAKFIAFLFTGSSAMLAEAGHSVADSGNQLVLLIGRRGSRRRPSAEHPFGFGRARYMAAFLVSVVLFFVGGLFGIYEGYNKLAEPRPVESWYWAVGVLLVAVVLEASSLRTAIRVSKGMRDGRSWVGFFRRVKVPELPVVLLEDIAALVGLACALTGVICSVLTGDPRFDAIGSMAIGVLLVAVSVVLGTETGSMVIGESATDEQEDRIREAVFDGDTVADVRELRTLHLGPEELLIVVRVALDEPNVECVTRTVEDVADRVRQATSTSAAVYVQPVTAVESNG